MRKGFAIFFLFLLLFSNWGYRWVFEKLEQKATARLDQQIDKGQYSEDQLFEIKIPLNLPYYSDRPYEQAYGETQWEGNYYRYVKRKVSHDTLFLLCIPHTEKDNLAAAQQDYWKSINDIHNGTPAQKQPVPGYVKLLLSEFTPVSAPFPVTDIRLIEHNYLQLNSSCTPQFAPFTDPRPPRA